MCLTCTGRKHGFIEGCVDGKAIMNESMAATKNDACLNETVVVLRECVFGLTVGVAWRRYKWFELRVCRFYSVQY